MKINFGQTLTNILLFAAVLLLAGSHALEVDSNVGGDGTSEQQKMVYYLIGNQEEFPNLRLSLWSQREEFDKESFGEIKLQGDLELRVAGWVDYDEEGNMLDNRLIEMGWMFRNTTKPDSKYDGIKVKFLYSHEFMNDPRIHDNFEAKAYTDYFELYDMYSKRLDREKKEPISMQIDNQTNWHIELGRSKKVCLDRGDCVFKVGFSRAY